MAVCPVIVDYRRDPRVLGALVSKSGWGSVSSRGLAPGASIVISTFVGRGPDEDIA